MLITYILKGNAPFNFFLILRYPIPEDYRVDYKFANIYLKIFNLKIIKVMLQT